GQGHTGVEIWSSSLGGPAEILAGGVGQDLATGILVQGLDGAVFATLEADDLDLWTTDGTALGTRHVATISRFAWIPGAPILAFGGALYAVLDRRPGFDLVRIEPGEVTTLARV